MGWHLAPQISFCIIARDVIFLDLAQDRYFQLGARHRDTFVDWCREGAPPCADLVTLLVDRGLIAPTDGADRLMAIAEPPATRELEPSSHSLLTTTVEAPAVLGSFHRAQRALKHSGLAQVLAERGSGGPKSPALLAARFCKTARRLAQNDNCLVRSLALRDYLDRHGSSATLVFGVTARPFRAHCWLQDGNLVLNDELDAVAPFTPILVR